MIIRKSRVYLIVGLIFSLCAVIMACPKSGLVPQPGTELTDEDMALNAYYQALKWRNNTVENIMANIKLMPIEDRAAWISRAEPIKNATDTALAGWKMAIDAGNYDDLSSQRQQFKALKNELLDLLFDMAQKVG